MSLTDLIWDWNGTLMDIEGEIFRIVNETLRNVSAPTVGRTQFQRGFNPKNPLEFYKRHSQGKIKTWEDLEKYGTFSIERLKNAPMYKGVHKALSELNKQGKRMYVLSKDGDKEYIKAKLEHEKIFCIPDNRIYCSEIEKVDYLPIILEENHIVPEQAVIIGDGEGDILAGKEHGLKTIAVLYGFGVGSEIMSLEPDSYIGHLKYLNEAIKELEEEFLD